MFRQSKTKTKLDQYPFRQWIEQSRIMLECAFNNLLYDRKLAVLNAFLKGHETKQLLKEKTNIFKQL